MVRPSMSKGRGVHDGHAVERLAPRENLLLRSREEQTLTHTALAQHETALALYDQVGQPLQALAQLLGLIALGGVPGKA